MFQDLVTIAQASDLITDRLAMSAHCDHKTVFEGSL